LGRHTPFFVTQNKGWFQEAGLDVRISRGYGGADGIKRLSAGETDLAMVDPTSLIIARSRGAKMKQLTVFYQRAPFAIYFLKRSGIRTPKDLEGHTIGAPVADANRTIFPAFAQLAGIDPARITWITMEAAAKTPSLLAGKVDAVPQFIFDHKDMETRGAPLGGTGSFIYADFGLDVYSNGLVATEETMRKRPDMLRKFIAAVVRGYQFTLDNPDEALSFFLKSAPELTKEKARAEIDVLPYLVLTDETKARGIGYISEKKLGVTLEMAVKFFNITSPPPLHEIYTNELLPRR
ncbi:MAG: ABC transporter substrate-binding protein, partial [Deltaproteobacteria bacterium]|nr:ABC transporter substrate-binding protein [Deltaproteobacteria bacterium]